jgi:hypothetical protein
MNFSTTPPCRSMATRMVSKYRPITWRSGSASSCSPIVVEPLTSAKSSVATRRTSAGC